MTAKSIRTIVLFVVGLLVFLFMMHEAVQAKTRHKVHKRVHHERLVKHPVVLPNKVIIPKSALRKRGRKHRR